MKKVLIISISRNEQTTIEEAQNLLGIREFNFETTASFGQEATWWSSQAPDVLILCLPPDDLMQGYFLTKLRVDIPRTLPLVLLSPVITAPLMQLSQMFTRVRMMKTPVEGGTLMQALRDLTQKREAGKQQIHPRYATDQEILVTSDLTNLRVNAVMKNLSMSGAYFETASRDESFQPSEIIKITITSGEPPREYAFDAKVVWTRPNLDSPGRGFGVTFVNKEEVYNNLLKGF